ncbi:M20 family metallo-hydrolase [Lacticaseibacillus sp. GG6-2]
MKLSPVSTMLDQLGQIGRDPEGGVTRLVYSDAWVMAQKFLLMQAKRAEMRVSVDRFGTAYMSYPGTDGKPAVAAGSHVDTVHCGGQYDGAYGVVAAMLAMQSLEAKYGRPKTTMTAVAFNEEEGSRFPISFSGSLHWSGTQDADDELQDADGVTFGAAKAAAMAQLATVVPVAEQPLPQEFLELHIEQGPQLEEQHIPLGVVSAICEQKRYTVTITGQANHAGTTPQHLRHDALKAASAAIMQLDHKAQALGEPFVFTVGEFSVTPGSSNVIPGTARFTIDIRHPDATVVDGFEQTIHEVLANLPGVKATLDCWMDSRPAIMAPRLVKQFQEIITARGLAYLDLPSGAGHDTQIMNQVVPTAMLFVPSRGGISHAPEEYTAPSALALGVEILEEQLYRECY